METSTLCELFAHWLSTYFRTKPTEDDINAYLKHLYSTFGGSKYILSNRSGELTSKQFTWLAKESGFIKVNTSPYTPTGNSIIERTHSFLKASLRKIIYNHNTDWDDIAHIAAMAYNVFPNSSSGESPILSNDHTYILTTFKLLLPKIRYMGDEKCRIGLGCHEGSSYDDSTQSQKSYR